MKVPKGKTVYIGGRKYVEGQELPPFSSLDFRIVNLRTENKKPVKEKNVKAEATSIEPETVEIEVPKPKPEKKKNKKSENLEFNYGFSEIDSDDE